MDDSKTSRLQPDVARYTRLKRKSDASAASMVIMLRQCLALAEQRAELATKIARAESDSKRRRRWEGLAAKDTRLHGKVFSRAANELVELVSQALVCQRADVVDGIAEYLDDDESHRRVTRWLTACAGVRKLHAARFVEIAGERRLLSGGVTPRLLVDALARVDKHAAKLVPSDIEAALKHKQRKGRPDTARQRLADYVGTVMFAKRLMAKSGALYGGKAVSEKTAGERLKQALKRDPHLAEYLRQADSEP